MTTSTMPRSLLISLVLGFAASHPSPDSAAPTGGNPERRKRKDSLPPRTKPSNKVKVQKSSKPSPAPRTIPDDILNLVAPLDCLQNLIPATHGQIALKIYGKKVTLSPRRLRLLAYLIQENRLVSKDELRKAIGLRPEVKGHRIPLEISVLRNALRDTRLNGCIAVIYSGGYRIFPPVKHQ